MDLVLVPKKIFTSIKQLAWVLYSVYTYVATNNLL